MRVDGAWQEKMERKLESPEGKAVYRLRKQIVEPVFGHLKTRYGLRQILLRGKAGASCEYLLACMAHNIGKMHKVWAMNGALVAAMRKLLMIAYGVLKHRQPFSITGYQFAT